jgi:hypothetical protein
MDTELLANLIDQKQHVLTQLWQLARGQSDVVQTGDVSRLMSLLALKQRALHQLQDLERQLQPFREQDPESRTWRSPQHREQTRVASAHCESLLQQIMSTEQACVANLTLRRDAAASQLQSMHGEVVASQAYAVPVTDLSQLDVSSES